MHDRPVRTQLQILRLSAVSMRRACLYLAWGSTTQMPNPRGGCSPCMLFSRLEPACKTSEDGMFFPMVLTSSACRCKKRGSVLP